MTEEQKSAVIPSKLKDASIFGVFDRVQDWVKKARENLRNRIRLFNSGAITLGRIAPEPAPMRGWIFDVPAAFRNINRSSISSLFGVSRVVPPSRGSSVRDAWNKLSSRARSATGFLEISESEAEEELEGGWSHAELAHHITSSETALPDNYDFFEKYPKCNSGGWSQGQCGSCWAFSVAAMATHRLCKKMSDASWSFPTGWKFGPQGLVSCATEAKTGSPGNNGCAGGITDYAASWIAERSTAVWSNFPYVSGNEKVSRADLCPKEAEAPGPKLGPFTNRLTKRYDVLPENAREDAIRRTVMEEGPVSISVQIPSIFMGYRGAGVFFRSDKDDWLQAGKPGELVHAFHAMLIYGWGVESDGKKYWLVENSWGNMYTSRPAGMQHTIKFTRGSNNCQIEGLSVLALNFDLPATNPFANSNNNNANANNNNSPTQPKNVQPNNPGSTTVDPKCNSIKKGAYCSAKCPANYVSGSKFCTNPGMNCCM